MKEELLSQYKAALSVLVETIEICPDSFWDNSADPVAFWQLVYHALYFTDLYLAENSYSFIRWAKHRPEYQKLGKLPVNRVYLPQGPYTKADMRDYITAIGESLENRVKEDSPGAVSGFPWLIMNKLELNIYNIRHLQHHTGQLIERLHINGISGISWITQFFDDDT